MNLNTQFNLCMLHVYIFKYVHTLDMINIDDSLSEVFGRTKLHNFFSPNICYVLLKKVIAI